MAALTHPFASGHRRLRWLAGDRSERRRARLAGGLERSVSAARRPERGFTAAVPVQRREVLAVRGLVLELASRLRGPENAPPDVLRAVDRLLTDPCSPLFSPAPPGTLHDVVFDAILELDHAGPSAP